MKEDKEEQDEEEEGKGSKGQNAAATTASEHDSIGLYSTILGKFQANCEKNSTKKIRIILGTPHPIPDTDNHNSVRKTTLSGLHCSAEMRNGSLRMHAELEVSG